MQIVDPVMTDLPVINFKEALNEEQYAAVTAPQVPALVLAGAGSGKTRTLTYRVAYLLSQGTAPWEILLLTFTNKSAKEMLGRVEELTSVPAHKFWGGTFHHIGQRILRHHADRVGLDKSFTILDAGDAEALLSEVVRNYSASFFKDKEHPKVRIIAEIISFARNTCTAIVKVLKDKYPHFSHLEELIVQFERNYKAEKLKQQVVDYDDLLEYWLKLLTDCPDITEAYQTRFKNILVDEYQDTNIIQAQIIDKMGARHHNIMVVGDDAQCIYTWRGANFENIMTFPIRHPGAQIFKIVTNYRSTPNILKLANSVLEHQPPSEGYHKELNAVRASGQKPYFTTALDTRHQASFIIKRIQGVVREGYRLGDIAVLYRAHHHAMDLQMELSRQQIPYQITSGVRFFEQAHVKDLVSQLRFACNFQDSVAFVRFACLLPKVGPRTADRIFKSLHVEAEKVGKTPYAMMDSEIIMKKVPEPARDDWKDLAYTLQDLSEELSRMTPEEAVKLLHDGWYSYYIRNLYTNWRSRQDDLESLVGFAKRFDTLPDLLAQLVLLSSEMSDRSVDGEEDCVRLTTIHQSKGLEFSIVFVIGLAENLFPLKRAVEEGNVEEERRLFYVAVTRAKDELYLSQPKVTIQGGPPQLLKPSRFVKELSEDTYEDLKLGTSSQRPY